jgi:hypothetical protein
MKENEAKRKIKCRKKPKKNGLLEKRNENKKKRGECFIRKAKRK